MRHVLLLASFAPSLVNFRGPLIKELLHRGHRVTVVAPDFDQITTSTLRGWGASPRACAVVNSSLDPLSTMNSLIALTRLLGETKPDVLIAYTIKPVILGMLAGRIRCVERKVALITGLGYAFTGGGELKRVVSRVIASFLYRIALALADIVLFQNKDDQALFRTLRLLPKRKQVAIVNGSGIDVDHFTFAEMPKKISFLMISRLLGDKGIREFAEAAKRLKATHPAVRVALVGYLDPSPDCINQAEVDAMIASGIEFLGRMDDVRPAISGCSVYVLPSYREGTPRSVLEAMAMGRAIITTDAPGCRETVMDGRNGFLVPPRDADALYRAMLRFVEQPELATAMGAESRKIAEEKYDVRKVNADLMRHAGL